MIDAVFPHLPPAQQWLLLTWLAAIGGCVGSFLNVVIYRLPAGLSIVHPGSRCPKCLHPIRWFDNLPVVSWLVLRGRCRDCRVPIPLRYPTVELLIFLVFLTLGCIELLTGGSNLPITRRTPLGTNELVAAFALHVTLVTTLFAAGLMRYDGHVPPARLYAFGLVVAIGATTVWPHARPVIGFATQIGRATAWTAAVESLAGFSLGWILGSRMRRSEPVGHGRWRFSLEAGMVGLTLGWQAGALCLAVAQCVRCLLAPLGARTWPYRLISAFVVWAFVIGWRPVLHWWPTATPLSDALILVASWAVVSILAFVESLVEKRP